MEIFSKNITVREAFNKADQFLSFPVRAFSDILLKPSQSIAFEAIKQAFLPMGLSRVGFSTGRENGLLRAVEEAIHSPLLGGISLREAKGLISHISIPGEVTIGELREAVDSLLKEIGDCPDPIFNQVTLGNGIPAVTIIATGVEKI